MSTKQRTLKRTKRSEESDGRPLSSLREQDQVIAILCADLHLSQRPPRARRQEPDWFVAMAKPLNELRALHRKYEAPILCAGDVFDHWRAEPELINFTLNFLPEMFAIPGQHDLPLHSIDLIKRSAFWTMCLTNKITPVLSKQSLAVSSSLVVHGFPWGAKLAPYEGESKKFQLALCHDYFWKAHNASSYPGAPASKEASQYKDLVAGYHAVVFGDNHKGFLTSVNKIPVLNCGGFMRRASDEADYEPQVGLLCRSGEIVIHKLKTRHEKFLTLAQEEEGIRKSLRTHDLDDFITGLSELQHNTFDFLQAIEMALEKGKVDNKVRRLVLEALGRE